MNEQRPMTGSLPPADQIEALIREDKPKELVEWAEQIGQRIARQVTTSQIRNVYGTVRQIQTSWPREPEKTADAKKAEEARKKAADSYRQAVLLRPKLGYASARERGQGMKDLEAVLTPALNEMMKGKTPEERRDRFMRFADFFEAILAYHKKYGGS